MKSLVILLVSLMGCSIYAMELPKKHKSRFILPQETLASKKGHFVEIDTDYRPISELRSEGEDQTAVKPETPTATKPAHLPKNLNEALLFLLSIVLGK